MNLKHLKKWVEQTQNLKIIRELVRKDMRGNPIENDINIGLKMLGEIKKRAQLVEDCLKKAEKYQDDIAEYLMDLEKRGIVFPNDENPASGTDIEEPDAFAGPGTAKSPSKVEEPDPTEPKGNEAPSLKEDTGSIRTKRDGKK